MISPGEVAVRSILKRTVIRGEGSEGGNLNGPSVIRGLGFVSADGKLYARRVKLIPNSDDPKKPEFRLEVLRPTDSEPEGLVVHFSQKDAVGEDGDPIYMCTDFKKCGAKTTPFHSLR